MDNIYRGKFALPVILHASHSRPYRSVLASSSYSTWCIDSRASVYLAPRSDRHMLTRCTRDCIMYMWNVPVEMVLFVATRWPEVTTDRDSLHSWLPLQLLASCLIACTDRCIIVNGGMPGISVHTYGYTFRKQCSVQDLSRCARFNG